MRFAMYWQTPTPIRFWTSVAMPAICIPQAMWAAASASLFFSRSLANSPVW
jgi:hypothetical protein